ncbi:indole-3-acetaldehyde oxidase-like [Vanessa cardui]|uniref:indole-3-acetaldehyde oxidase-like n=1 Tax=Vanessa cardui TaxID=171605 RepID=UPI001F1446EB|nr:indole-3-acetaldehyde oxidase-like [Vanessa cardui]XP_046967893.1 indole-3-acetaldehyde oxidase-like [Vanessa cardui]
MDKINFTVNGEPISLNGADVSPLTSLNDYLRNYLGLLGTKAMCHEGGCGACIVSVTKIHPGTNEKHIIAVNSCLVHVLSCHEWEITTIEGVGSKKDGYNSLQSRLASFNGTQCGYCTPGWVMNMYSLFEGSKKNLTTRQIERSFAGNICRCTGYRPILDAFKTFASDTEARNEIKDLEELDKIKCAKKCLEVDNVGDGWCFVDHNNRNVLDIKMDTNRWYKAFSVDDVFKVLAKEGTDNYSLVAGNTGRGVYPPTNESRVYIDISSISALKDTSIDANLVLGAGLSLNETMAIFQEQMKNDDFSYLKQFYDHLELVANVPVKNVGTIGGNLAMKNNHPYFASDVYVLLETVNATVTLEDMHSKTTEIHLSKFLSTSLKDQIIMNVKIPPLSNSHLIRTYKIMPRAQNAHAIVNAGFNFHVDENHKILTSNIVYGSISPTYNRAINIENMLKGQPLFSDETLRTALAKLQEDIVPFADPSEPSPFCKKAIALGLFYKAILSLSPSVNPRYVSGGSELVRPISSGIQSYETDKSMWPLNQPVPKLEALTQCSGEALYACDQVSGPRDVHVAFVLSTICLGEIVQFDTTEALKLPGVVAFLSAKDIPGKNSFISKEVPWQEFEEEILASKKISYYGQPIGLIAAVSRKLAIMAAGLVKVSYKKYNTKPVLSISEALNAPDKKNRIREEVTIQATDKGNETTHTIKGHYYMPDQYHFTMETQSCRVEHTRRGIRVLSATQWIDLVHVAVARSLDLPLNSVDVSVARVGGAYGGKASRSALAACACAVAAHALNRAATLVMPLTDNMHAVGKRQAAYFEYELGVNDDGVIQHADIVYYSDCGYSYNDTSGAEIASTMTYLYDTSRWNIKGYSILTDKASNTWCRAPATTEGTAIVEHLMERISHITKKDPVDVRKINIPSKHDKLKDMIDTFKMDTNYNDRRAEIETYNATNAWKKKGLQLTIMCYPIVYHRNYSVTISVYHADGTILMSHGGIEMGQGINTKVAQVCAYTLNVPLSMVTVKGSDNFVAPNNIASSGSITSEAVAFATVKACNELLKRLEPIKQELEEPTWQKVVKTAFDKGINLQVNAMTSQLDNLVGYPVYGVCSAEVHLDVLTGNHIINRVDLLEDTGRSLNPDIDVGQIEGSFVMGLGLWTSERLIYDTNGQLLTNRTWTYKPPGACDIPVDFRISFSRNSINNNGVLGSKATGEPAFVLAVVVIHALHEAIVEARKEYGYNDTEWVHVDTPYSVENIIKGISPNIKSYTLK